MKALASARPDEMSSKSVLPHVLQQYFQRRLSDCCWYIGSNSKSGELVKNQHTNLEGEEA
jgi:hypothetical protein